MKRTIITIMFAFIVLANHAQTTTGLTGSNFTALTTVDIHPMKIIYQGDWRIKYKPIDTVSCFMSLQSKTSNLQGWQSGYVVLIDGKLIGKYVEWTKPYIPMALGLFENTFLGSDRKEVVKDDYVFQVILKP